MTACGTASGFGDLIAQPVRTRMASPAQLLVESSGFLLDPGLRGSRAKEPARPSGVWRERVRNWVRRGEVRSEAAWAGIRMRTVGAELKTALTLSNQEKEHILGVCFC